MWLRTFAEIAFTVATVVVVGAPLWCHLLDIRDERLRARFDWEYEATGIWYGCAAGVHDYDTVDVRETPAGPEIHRACRNCKSRFSYVDSVTSWPN